MMEEPWIEPENRTVCEVIQEAHVWVWDEDQDDYYCDECGVYHEQQEE